MSVSALTGVAFVGAHEDYCAYAGAKTPEMLVTRDKPLSLTRPDSYLSPASTASWDPLYPSHDNGLGVEIQPPNLTLSKCLHRYSRTPPHLSITRQNVDTARSHMRAAQTTCKRTNGV